MSHLSAMFGLVEICADIIDSFPAETGAFKGAWLEYCRFFNAAEDVQRERYGESFGGKLQLQQGHARLTAYAASVMGDEGLARRAWSEFFDSDGYGVDMPWESEVVGPPDVLADAVDEAAWVSTNLSSMYGLAAMQNLAWVGDYL